MFARIEVSWPRYPKQIRRQGKLLSRNKTTRATRRGRRRAGRSIQGEERTTRRKPSSMNFTSNSRALEREDQALDATAAMRSQASWS